MAEKRKIPEKKIRAVKHLAEEMKKSNTIMIVSTKNLPSSQLQKIKKQLRGKADIMVAKKSTLIRAIDEAKISEMLGLKEHVKSDCAILFSKDDAFELAAWLSENKSSVSAKQGQTADEDIIVEAGQTNLMPGPDISILGSAGLKVSVEEGKIAIREPKVVVKKGEIVKENVAAILQKLDIKPFMIGLNPAVMYDKKEKKIYVGVKIDKKQALHDLLICYGKALGFARNLNIITRETIGYLLAKANMQAMALGKLIPKKEEIKVSPEQTNIETKSQEGK